MTDMRIETIGSRDRQARGARRRALRSFLVVASLVAFASLGCARRSAPAAPATLVVASFTATREVYTNAIIPAFQAAWKARTGSDVRVDATFGPSGAQAQAIVNGTKADVAALSMAGDVSLLVERGLVSTAGWGEDHPHVVSTSLVVFAVRPGNPLGIADWPDLARPGLRVLTPDPRTSGAGKWNACAVYGAALQGFAGRPRYDRDAARGFLRDVYRNVTRMDAGARDAITAFESGHGDVAITYESELLGRGGASRPDEYVVPPSTLLIENPAAVVDHVASEHGVLDVAQGFVEFLEGPEAQRAFARYGFRPVRAEAAAGAGVTFRDAGAPWRIGALGNWKVVSDELFGPNGAMAAAEASARPAE